MSTLRSLLSAALALVLAACDVPADVRDFSGGELALAIDLDAGQTILSLAQPPRDENGCLELERAQARLDSRSLGSLSSGGQSPIGFCEGPRFALREASGSTSLDGGSHEAALSDESGEMRVRFGATRSRLALRMVAPADGILRAGEEVVLELGDSDIAASELQVHAVLAQGNRTEHVYGARVDGGQIRFTVPSLPDDMKGPATLQLAGSHKPRVTECQGPASCRVVVFGISSSPVSVTIER
jgi:hypothetical protein